jgi:hypothetical protein
MAWYEPNRAQISSEAEREAARIYQKHHGDCTSMRAAFEKHREDHARLHDRRKCFNQDRMAALTEAFLIAIERAETTDEP